MENNLNSEIKQLLQLKDDIPIFNGLDDDEIVSIVDQVKISQYTKGQVIIQEGTRYEKFFHILLQGSVEVKKIVSSNEKTLANINAIGTFGEISALTNLARSASIVSTHNNTTILAFTIKDNDDSGKALFYKNIICELSNKLINVNGGRVNETSLWDL